MNRSAMRVYFLSDLHDLPGTIKLQVLARGYAAYQYLHMFDTLSGSIMDRDLFGGDLLVPGLRWEINPDQGPWLWDHVLTLSDSGVLILGVRIDTD